MFETSCEMETFKCDACSNSFDLSAKVNLPCYHHWCQTCAEHLKLENSSTNGPFCPLCISQICLFAKAFIAERSSFIEMKTEIQSQVDEPGPNFLQSVDHCEAHNNVNHFRCMDHERWICGICGMVNHKNCRVLLVAEALDEMKGKMSKIVEEELKPQKAQEGHCKTFIKQLQDKQNCLAEEIKALQLESFIKELTSCSKDIEKLREHQLIVNCYCDELKRFRVNVSNSTDCNELSRNIDILMNFVQTNRRATEEIDIPWKRKHHLTIQEIKNWCEEKCVFALKRQQEIIQYARVEVTGDKIFVDIFTDQKPEKNYILLSFKELLITFSGSFDFRV